MIKLYDFEHSGNCYKVRLLLSALGLEHELVPVDIFAGEHKQPTFLKLNPLGQIPALTDGDVTLRDSQAMLIYLARRYGDGAWLPLEPEPMAAVVQWLLTAANELQNGPYTARLGRQFKLDVDVPVAQEKAPQILGLMEAHLDGRSWLEQDHPTIADIACYPAVALAPVGEISLDPYPAINAWLGRVHELPGYVGMPGID